MNSDTLPALLELSCKAGFLVVCDPSQQGDRVTSNCFLANVGFRKKQILKDKTSKRKYMLRDGLSWLDANILQVGKEIEIYEHKQRSRIK